MEYRFFSEYVKQPVPGVPFMTQEDQLIWTLDSEADGCDLADRVLRDEINRHGIHLVSLLLKRGNGTLNEWETIRTFPVHKEPLHGGADVLS